MTSTITREEIRERVDELTDHDFEPPCDGRPGVEDCGQAATWAALFSCMDDRLWCDGHKANAVEAGKHPAGLTCLTCATIGVHIVHIEPIGGH